MDRSCVQDWPIPQVPAGTPPVPVLVLDLEDTLVHSEWSVRSLLPYMLVLGRRLMWWLSV